MNLKSEDYIHGGTQKSFYSQEEVISSPCPFCGNEKFEEIYKERGSIGISKCHSCGLVYTNPHLKEPEKIYWGESEKYFNEGRLIFQGSKRHHRDNNYEHDIKILMKYRAQGKFLDIGTNMGFFLRHAKNNPDWDLLGVEPSPSLSKLAQDYFGLNIINDFLENVDFQGQQFDIVTLTDVFEHILNPTQMLTKIQEIIKPDGILFIKVPNVNYSLFKLKMAKLLKKEANYDIFDSYEHVVHYSFKTLSRMLEKHGFKIEKKFIDPPIQIPVWHHLVGAYYLYESPFWLDRKHFLLRSIFYRLSKIEFNLKLRKNTALAPNISVIAKKI